MTKISTAAFSWRALALFIDWTAATLLAVPLYQAPANATDFQYLQFAMERNWIITEIFLATQVLFVWLFGSSLGQRICRLRVVSVTGKRLTLMSVLVRSLLLVLVIPAVITDSNSRGLHDRLAKTQILRF